MSVGTAALAAGPIFPKAEAAAPRTIVYWRQINTSTFMVTQEGDIDLKTELTGEGIYAFMPSISVNAANDVVICYSVGSARKNPEIWYSARKAGDPLHMLQLPVFVQASQTGYKLSDRWGDYSAVSIDPVDGSFWICNELSHNFFYWTTWIRNFDF